jgi:hypothetical protein
MEEPRGKYEEAFWRNAVEIQIRYWKWQVEIEEVEK